MKKTRRWGILTKTLISLVVLIVICFIGYLSVSTGLYNLDYLGQGKLESVTIDDKNCITSLCENATPQIFTVSDPKQLKSLESTFFNKIQDVFHNTKEDGSIKLIFHYEKRDIEFHAGITCDQSSGRIYYTDRQITYLFSKRDMQTLKDIFAMKCP